MEVFIEHDISGHTFLLLNQEYVPNSVVYITFLILAQEYGYKLRVCIITINNDHGIKVAQDSGRIQFMNLINDDQYEKFISCHNISNCIV